MTARDSDFDGALDVGLPFNIGEIDIVALMGREEFFEIALGGLQRAFAAQEGKGLAQITHTVNSDSSYHGRFLGIGLWHKERLLAASARLDRYRQDTGDSADRPVERFQLQIGATLVGLQQLFVEIPE